MKLGLLGVLAATAATAAGADLTGYWLLRLPTGDGNFRETVFELKQSGSTLTGTTHLAWGKLPIRDGSVKGSHVQFGVEFGDPPVRELYTGTLKGSELDLRWQIAGRPAQTGTAVAVTAASIQPPSRLPIPILRTLPSNGLALTPPMGWNSWNHVHTKVDDATIREIADAMAANGMRDAGYVYINIDDGWEGQRDSEGNLHPNQKFPDMKALADYVHAKGMLLGLYSSPGPKTCGSYEGSYGHETQDARTFASWGIDYLKYDWCSAGQIYKDDEMRPVFQAMGEALESVSRPIVYSISNGGRAEVWKWGAAAGANLWRTTDDIRDTWASVSRIGFSQDGLEAYAGQSHWNDPDMLEVGNGGMAATEYRSHMTLWSMLSAPLLVGNDVRHMTPETLSILTNREVIAIDRDALGKQGQRRMRSGELELWTKSLSDGSTALAWFNRGGSSATVVYTWADLGFSRNFTARNLWQHADVDTASGELTVVLAAHDCLLLRVTPYR